MTPIEILQEFINIFGVEQSIAGKNRKFFYGELIQQPDFQVTPINSGDVNEGHEVLQPIISKLIP